MNPGQQATLSVTAGSSGMANQSDTSITFQWYRGQSGDTSTPASSTSATLVTPALTGNSSFWVQLRNSAGLTANSGTATITLNTAPAIRTAPHSVNVGAGKSATLQVVAGASGTEVPGVLYDWFEGAAGTTTKSVGTHQPTFVTPPLDSGSVQYWVRLTNQLQSGSSLVPNLSTNSATVTVRVSGAPRIITQPVGTSILTGTQAVLSVAAESGTIDPVLHYKWYKGQSGDITHPVLDAGDGNRCATGQITVDTAFWVRVSNGTSGGSSYLATDSSTAMVRVFNTALPNLVPMPINARWTDPLAVSANPYGTTDDSVLLSNRNLFVGVSYKNNGIATAKPFRGTVTLQPGNKVMTFVQTAAIAPNGYGQQLAQRGLLLGVLPAGEYTLTVQLDSDKTVPESIETDNAYTKHITVINAPLVAATRLLAPTHLRGTASIVEGSGGVDLYWVAGDSYQTSWNVWRRQIVGRVWGRWAQVGTATAPIYRDSTITASTTYQYAVLGALGTKVSGAALSAVIAVPAVVNAQSVVDLSPTGLVSSMVAGATTDATLDNSGDVLTNLTITNAGTAATPSTGFSLNFVIDDHTTITIPTRLVIPALGSLVVPDLNLGRLTPGTHSVVVKVDPYAVLDEPVRTNNSFSTQLVVQSARAELTGFIDTAKGQTSSILIATQLKATTPAATVTTADHVYASISVANNGLDLLPTQNFNLGIYLDGKLISTKPITPGSDSAWLVQDVELGVMALGYHTLAVRIDDSDDAIEGDETDNLLVVRIPVYRPPVARR